MILGPPPIPIFYVHSTFSGIIGAICHSAQPPSLYSSRSAELNMKDSIMVHLKKDCLKSVPVCLGEV